MRTGKLVRIIAALFMLLSLVGVSTYAAAGYAPAAAQDPPPDVQAPGDPQDIASMPEIRPAGYSYNFFESRIAAGQPLGQADTLSPAAVEDQPKQLDWTPVRRVAVRPGYSQHIYAAIDNYYGLWRTTNGGDYWEQLPFGLGSGRIIVWYNSSIAVATFGYYDGGLTQYVNGGIWRTSDGGNTWQDIGAGIGNMVVAFAFTPGNPNRMYAGTLGGGIYRGDDSGGSVTWTQKNSGISDSAILSVAVAPDHANIVYAGGYSEVYRSDNSGDSWVVVDSAYPSDYTEGLAVAAGDGNTWYAGAQRQATSSDPQTYGGFYKSTTGAGAGALVLKNSGMTDTFVLDIARDPHNANILYAGTWASGFFRSDDGGETWAEKNADLYLPYIYGIEAVPDPGNPGGTILYLANFYDGAGVFMSTDRGETWTDPSSVGLPEKFDITTTTDAYHLAAATGQGVIYSYDGVTWYYSPDLTNFRNGIVLELARDPSNSSKLLAATYGGGIWTSTSAGRYWTETSTGIGGDAYVYDVGFSDSAANTAYAGSYGVYRTTNGGATWAPFGSVPYYVRDVDGHNGITPNLYAGTHNGGVWMSPNTNGTWTDISAGLGDLRVRSVKAVGASQVFAGTNGDSAWKYTGSWAQKGPSIRAPGVIQIVIHPNNQAAIFAGTDQGVYKSSDGGETWEPKNQGLGGYGDLVITGISIDPSSPNTIYLATWGYGIFQSTDGGDHWTRFADPIKSTKIYLPIMLNNYVPPQPAYLDPMADTTILAGYPTTNFGGSADMWVGYDFDACSGGHTSRSLMQFDTSPVSYGSTIFQAELYLRLVNSCDYDNRYHATTIYRIPSSWSYSTVTWNTQPSYAEAYGTTSVGSRTWGWYSFDVQSLVQGWVNGSFSNYGLMIRGPESSDTGARLGFATLNWDGTSYDPFIYLVWGSSDAPMGTAVLPAVGAPEAGSLGPAIREMLSTFPSTREETPSGYVDLSAPED
jgi:photosystem II stability/assembly factor-like uncharacterized protein